MPHNKNQFSYSFVWSEMNKTPIYQKYTVPPHVYTVQIAFYICDVANPTLIKSYRFLSWFPGHYIDGKFK